MNNVRWRVGALCVGALLCGGVLLGNTQWLLTSSSETFADKEVFSLKRNDSALQKALEKALARAGLTKYIKQKRLAISVVDVTESKRPVYAGVNDNEMFYAASLPKIAILLAVVRAAAKRRIAWTPGLRRRLKSMITESSNLDAAWATDLVGLAWIEETVRAYGLYEPKYGGLWMGRAYRRGARARREPLKNLSHAATARQAVRFYALLRDQRLISKRWSREMLKLMGPPGHRHKFVAGIGRRQAVQFQARKSGTWRTFHSDSALIRHHDRQYAIAALSDLRHGEAVIQQIARIVDDVIMARRKRPAKKESQHIALR